MGVPQAIVDRYDQAAPEIKGLHGYVLPTLRRFCDQHGYTLDDRVKSLESVAEKLESGRFRKWSTLDDLVGFAIVVPTSGHEESVVAFLDATYQRTSLRDRNTAQKAPDVFRFDSARWYGRLEVSDPPPRIVDGAAQVTFEVQIKTAFEHAWSVVTHDIVYKGDDVDWNKRRLAAQLKAMVEQMDLMVEHFELVSSKVPASGFAETDAMSKTTDTLKQLVSEGLLDETLVPLSWTRLAENLLGLCRAGGRSTTGRRLRKLIEAFDDGVRAEDFLPARSGSLYQAVVAFAIGAEALDLTDVPIVASSELADIYRVEVPAVVELDA